MKKEEINVIAQLIAGMRDSAEKLDEMYKKGDRDGLASMKREILKLQKEIDKRL
jgi:hypothetical protein